LSASPGQLRLPQAENQLVLPWLEEGVMDKANSYVIGDRATDISWRITWALPACAMTAKR
jgi:histidinol phosphatase-like enzyme